jgi:hypothetical protein
MVPEGEFSDNTRVQSVGGISGQYVVGEPVFDHTVPWEGGAARKQRYKRTVVATIGVLPFRWFEGTRQAQVLIPPRFSSPAVNAWIIGTDERIGGETLEQATQRLCTERLGLAQANPAVMFFVGDYEVQWDTQPGWDDDGAYHERMAIVAYGVDAKEELTLERGLDPAQFWTDIQAVINAEPGDYHPTLVQIIKRLKLQLNKLPRDQGPTAI